MKKVNIFCHSFQKVKPIYYIENQINKKGYFKQKCKASEKYVHLYALNTFGWIGWTSFCMNYCINVAWHGCNQPVALLRCNEAQVALIAALG